MENYEYLVNKPKPSEIILIDMINKPNPSEIKHYGIIGMHWGVRRYQNPDGTLTDAGKRQRNKLVDSYNKHLKKRIRQKGREKARIAKDPGSVQKNIDKFTEDELNALYKKFEMQQKFSNLNIKNPPTHLDRAQAFIDKTLNYGKTANNTLKFLNSNVGKGIRQQLGFSTETLWNFNSDKEKKEDKD